MNFNNIQMMVTMMVTMVVTMMVTMVVTMVVLCLCYGCVMGGNYTVTTTETMGQLK